MALDDLPLNRPPASPGNLPPRGASPARWIVAALVGLAAGALLTFWWMNRARPGNAAPPPTAATDVPVQSGRPTRQPINLPSLDASDALLRDLVSALSRHPTLARFLATPGLVRAATLAVVQIGDGRTPATPLAALKPGSSFGISGTGPSGRIDPATFARWDNATAALTSINAADAAQLYVNVKPLFDEAYIELGHPGGDFDTAVVSAIEMLADTPALPDDAVVLRRRGYFEHESDALRTLPPVQKQFLLLGPANRQKVMAWLRQFADTLDLKLE
jgi:hypothetical protein